jgi:N-acetylneuraminate synthase
MSSFVRIGNKEIGPGRPVYVIGEIGINHNGDLGIAKQLIDVAARTGCDAVKFQKRTPEVCVPENQKNVMRSTPWGDMTYLDYRYKVEFGEAEYAEIKSYCAERGIHWFASPWDVPSVDFLEAFDPVCHKVASASITDHAMLDRLRETGRPIIMSTGMSTMDEIAAAVEHLDRDRLILMHTTSSYPCPAEDSNLNVMAGLRQAFGVPVGYSGHERGLQISVAAVALGACVVERHITTDRAMWGSDQAASLEPHGLEVLVRDIRIIEKALGDGIKRVTDSEVPIRAKLRRP